MSQSFQRTAICCAITVLVAACGGGKSTINGSVTKGPIAASQVCFYELASVGKGKLLACTNTNSNGTYNVQLNYTGAVYTEASNGTYTDETTGLKTVLNTTLVSVASVTAGLNTTIVTTPLTTLAARQATERGSNLTLLNYNINAARIGAAFGINTSLTLTQPNTSLSSDQPYGNALKSISKLIHAGVPLNNITMTSNNNTASLRQNSILADQCIVVADPSKANSTPSLGGSYYTNPSAPDPSFNNSISNNGSIVTNITTSGGNLFTVSKTYKYMNASSNKIDQIVLNNTYKINSLANGSVALDSALYTSSNSTFSIISAKEPDPKWRSLVTAAGLKPMGCTLLKNSPAEVTLNCSADAVIAGDLNLYSGTWVSTPAVANINNLPSSGLLVKAKSIEILNSMNHSVGPLKIYFNNTCRGSLLAQNLTPPTSMFW